MTNYLCFMTGSSIPTAYVDRLYKMLELYAPKPFTLTCVRDRELDILPEIVQVDIAQWPMLRADMRPTQFRLSYFASETCPLPEFISLDVTLIIKGPLDEFVAFANSRPEPLVIRQDWHRPTINGAIMRVRRSDALRAIYDDYVKGMVYPSFIKGDQDFIDGAIKAHGLQEHVAHFPEEMIASYKNLRTIRHKDPAKAQAILDRACILKFHGKPRPHDLFERDYWVRYFKQKILKAPAHFFKDYGYLRKEVRRWWLDL